MKRILALIVILLSTLCFTSCNSAYNIQHNIGQQSDNFETYRKITVINLRSDKVLLEVEGYLSIKDSNESELAVIVRTSPKEYKMHYIYTGSEIVYLVEQLENSTTDPYHWEIKIFAVTPKIEVV